MGALGIGGGVLARAAAVAADLDADATELLTGRAAVLGLAPGGRVSAGGATRLIEAADGWWALTLSRADDIAALPALLQADAVGADHWSEVARWAATQTAADAVGRARLLDLPAARLGETPAAAPRTSFCGRSAAPRSVDGLVVADLTSMWAGPLCGALLARAGALVVKVESPSRPDGTRSANREFFDWVNGGKLSYSVDFDAQQDRLRALLGIADIVLEGSRPAALARRGLGPDDIDGPPGRVWLRLSGYGRAQPDRVAFGDDAAVAGGLVGADDTGPVFIGDAIADPLTGLEAAAAVKRSVRRGGGQLIEIALAQVAAGYAAEPPAPATDLAAVRPVITARASALGADNAAVEKLVADRSSEPC